MLLLVICLYVHVIMLTFPDSTQFRIERMDPNLQNTFWAGDLKADHFNGYMLYAAVTHSHTPQLMCQLTACMFILIKGELIIAYAFRVCVCIVLSNM